MGSRKSSVGGVNSFIGTNRAIHQRRPTAMHLGRRLCDWTDRTGAALQHYRTRLGSTSPSHVIDAKAVHWARCDFGIADVCGVALNPAELTNFSRSLKRLGNCRRELPAEQMRNCENGQHLSTPTARGGIDNDHRLFWRIVRRKRPILD
jgi:hypothetical protein